MGLIGQILPAREWEKEGLRVQQFFQLHRHRHLDIVANTQDVSLVAKTVGIVASRWILCERTNNFIIDWIFKNLLDLEFVMLKKNEMSYQGLKKMANGWELNQTLDPNKGLRGKRKWYLTSKIMHKELNRYKIELVHRYCPLCAMRQGEQIKVEDTDKVCIKDKRGRWQLKEKEYCPKHKDTELQIRLSGIYDTDHEPEVKEKKIILQPMIDSPAGYTRIKYNGRLSERQAAYKAAKEQEYN